MAYNTTFMNNVTQPLDLLIGIGSAIGKEFLIGNVLLLAFFLIVLIILIKNEDVVIALVIDGFISTIVAILLYFSGLISATTIAFPVLIFMICLVFELISGR